MALTIRSQLVAGKTPDYAGADNGHRRYDSSDRRAGRLMCEGCIRGKHATCESEDCPCVCNDSDFRWARRA